MCVIIWSTSFSPTLESMQFWSSAMFIIIFNSLIHVWHFLEFPKFSKLIWIWNNWEAIPISCTKCTTRWRDENLAEIKSPAKCWSQCFQAKHFKWTEKVGKSSKPYLISNDYYLAQVLISLFLAIKDLEMSEMCWKKADAARNWLAVGSRLVPAPRKGDLL